MSPPPQSPQADPRPPRALPVWLFVPNLLCYARVLGVAVAFFALIPGRLGAFLVAYGLLSLLDMADGYLARRLGQTSNLGVVLDLIADNVSRTLCWASVLTTGSAGSVACTAAVLIPCLEWVTALATQVISFAARSGHWKSAVKDPGMPRLLQAIFSNGFYNPVGAWVVLSLFGLPAVIGLRSTPQFAAHPVSPVLDVLLVLLAIGRALGAAAEVVLVQRTAQWLVALDKTD
mmetsp:Transcript_2261/g.4577  ORF Transcript_2261/g.4577 Transcript_2261/m.4577 type:complete len:232 (+) Transcript_2261:33-728(+)